MKRKWFPTWLILPIALMAIGTVWLRLAIVRTTYQINQATQEIRALQQAREQQELKVTGDRSPRKLEVLAKGRFNLIAPKPEQVIYLKSAHPIPAPQVEQSVKGARK